MKTLISPKLGASFAGAILLGALANLPVLAQNYPTLIEAQSPLNYWRFNETTNSPAINTVANLGSTGAAGTGYALDGAITGQRGIVGNCVLLTNVGQAIGDCYTRIDIPNVPALNPEPPFTIEFWLKPNAPFAPNGDATPPTGLCALSSDSPDPGGSSRSGYLFYVLPGSITFRLGGEESYCATAAATLTVSTNSWTQVVGEFDGTTAMIYINGELAGSGVASLSAPFHPNQWVTTRVGGTSLDGSEFTDVNGNLWYLTGNRGWDGWIDEFAIYNTLLTSNTIAAHYSTATNNPSGYDALVLASHPVGYWNFDEPAYTEPSTNTYTFAADLGSLGDNGTNTLGTLADQPGVPGLSSDSRSVSFSGVMGSLELATNAAVPDLGGQTVTMAAWIMPSTLGVGYAGSIVVQGYDPNSGYQENYLRICDTYDWEGNGDPDVTYYDVGTYNGGSRYNSAIFPVPPGDLGQWVFLVGTYDGANWNLYRNGSLVSSFADGGSGPASLTLPWSVGSRTDPDPFFGFFFPGSISEAALFGTALDPTTISNLYNSVQRAPVITQAPQAPSPAYEGSAATFSVWADGPGTLAYQWTSNTVPIAGQTDTNLSLTGLTAADDATYSVVVTNLYGAATSSVVLVVTPSLPPVTVVPAAETRWIGSPFSFAPAGLPNQTLSYQWNFDGGPIGGATQSNYSATTGLGSGGTYTLVISNSFGTATSSVATLTVLTPPPGYASTILADHPLSYFRLDETSGTIAHDYAGGNNGNYYDVELAQPGALFVNPDFAVTFLGVTNSYVGDIGTNAIDFSGTTAEFSIEAWANGGSDQISGAAVIAKGTGNVGANNATEQFAIGINTGVYRFFVRDKKGNIAAADAQTGPDGNWHYLVGVCDEIGGTITLYIDGSVAGSGGFSSLVSAGILDSHDAVSIGAERSGVLPPYDWAYKGTIDEVAIYNTALTFSQVQTHYAAAYGTNTPVFIKTQPVSVTNYVSLPVTVSVDAAGTVPLTYQWNQEGVGPVSGATGNTLTFYNLAYSNAGTYTVNISNSISSTNSIPFTITVLEPPTNPPAIPGLVMHLTFDNTLVDATGRGNNATNEASGGAALNPNPYIPGKLGQAFSYQTTANSSTTNANYASVGVRPDLQFGSNISFTVSMWVQLPANYIGNDLPFFTDSLGSTYGKGYLFAPTFGTTVGTTKGVPGGWAYSIYDNPQTNSGKGVGVYGAEGSINDGNWHSLVYVIDRINGGTVYLDGTNAPYIIDGGTSVEAAGDIDTTNSATIGQDPTGLYGGSTGGTFGIDDLGVWHKALTPLEAASIYMAAASNQLSFVGAPITLSINSLSGLQKQVSWNAGSLQSAPSLTGPWTIVPGATSPYTIIPTGTALFYRVKL